MQKREIYSVEGDKLVRARKACPKCGPGVYMGAHPNRTACGRCGYTEFKPKGE